MNIWKKRLIMFCIGCAIGSSCVQFYKGNFAAGIGFLVSCIYAIGWRIECGIAEQERNEAKLWRTTADKMSRS